jgi:hypothetical protein
MAAQQRGGARLKTREQNNNSERKHAAKVRGKQWFVLFEAAQEASQMQRA